MTLEKTAYENILGKEENSGYQDFLHFHIFFLQFQSQDIIICFFFRLQNALNSDQSQNFVAL